MIRVMVEYHNSPVRVQRAAAQIFRRAYIHAGEMWFRTMLPEHFAAGAASRYKYAVRTPRYMVRKARTKHHQRALVWSGETERMAMSMGAITSTAKGASVNVSVPAYFTRKGRRRSYDMARELTAVTAAEEHRLADEFDRVATAELNAQGTPSLGALWQQKEAVRIQKAAISRQKAAARRRAMGPAKGKRGRTRRWWQVWRRR